MYNQHCSSVDSDCILLIGSLQEGSLPLVLELLLERVVLYVLGVSGMLYLLRRGFGFGWDKEVASL